jgi:hypothetical protein
MHERKNIHIMTTIHFGLFASLRRNAVATSAGAATRSPPPPPCVMRGLCGSVVSSRRWVRGGLATGLPTPCRLPSAALRSPGSLRTRSCALAHAGRAFVRRVRAGHSLFAAMRPIVVRGGEHTLPVVCTRFSWHRPLIEAFPALAWAVPLDPRFSDVVVAKAPVATLPITRLGPPKGLVLALAHGVGDAFFTRLASAPTAARCC